MITKNAKTILQNAGQLALQLNIKTLFILSERSVEPEWFAQVPKELKIIIASSDQLMLKKFIEYKQFKLIDFPLSKLSRFSKMRSILITALSRGYINETEKIICLNGSIRNKAPFDSIDIINMDTQFKGLKYLHSYINEYKIQLNVVAAVMDVAIELGEFGREGKSLGAIFIVGDAKDTLAMSKQIVINPFSRVKEKNRNIKNPTIKESVLEFSKLDGAFIIRGDGTICAAGRLLFMPKSKVKILRGLGGRHNAAAYMTKMTKSIGIVVSETSGCVSVFKQGKLLFQLRHYLMQGRNA